MAIAATLIIITVIVCLVQTIAFRRLYRYVIGELERQPNAFSPKAAVILPCKGLDPDFRGNILKLLQQDYPNFEVIFAVATADDPAYKELVEISENSHVKTRVVIAGVNNIRAQKINNQLTALKYIDLSTEVLVFVDSDVIARKDFLRCLIAPLSESDVGVTTGYRFYISSLDNWPSLLRSLWNRVSAWELANPKFAFAWGGAMAVRRQIFEKAQVAARWDRAADDDLSLTTAVKELGLKVHFVPQCLVASDGDAPFAEIFEWTNRQLILTKVYYPQLWGRAIARAGIMALWLVSMIVAVLGWALGHDANCAIATLGGLAILPIEVYFLVRARSLWTRVLADRSDYLQESFASSCAAIPLAHSVLPWLTLFSLLTNRIQWRGVTYELRSPTETLVIS